MGEFNLRDGFTYERVSHSGDVRLRLRDHHGGNEILREVTIPEGEWASVVASVCVKGEDGDTWQSARDLHAGRVANIAARDFADVLRGYATGGYDGRSPASEALQRHPGH